MKLLQKFDDVVVDGLEELLLLIPVKQEKLEFAGYMLLVILMLTIFLVNFSFVALIIDVMLFYYMWKYLYCRPRRDEHTTYIIRHHKIILMVRVFASIFVIWSFASDMVFKMPPFDYVCDATTGMSLLLLYMACVEDREVFKPEIIHPVTGGETIYG